MPQEVVSRQGVVRRRFRYQEEGVWLSALEGIGNGDGVDLALGARNLVWRDGSRVYGSAPHGAGPARGDGAGSRESECEYETVRAIHIWDFDRWLTPCLPKSAGNP